MCDGQAGEGEWLPGHNYHTPLDAGAAAAVELAWRQLMRQDGCAREAPVTLPVLYGRSLEVGTSQRAPALPCPPSPSKI